MRKFVYFLSLFSASNLANAGYGCLTISNTGQQVCGYDEGMSRLQTALAGFVGLMAISVAVVLIYKIMSK